MSDSLFDLEAYVDKASYLDYQKDLEGWDDEPLPVVGKELGKDTNFSRGNEQCNHLEPVDFSRESEGSTKQPTILADLTGECQLKLIAMPSPFCDRTGIPQFTETSKTSSLSPEIMTCSSEASLVMEPLKQVKEKDSITQSQPSFGSSSDASANAVHPWLSWSSLRDLSIADLEAGLEESEWQDIKASLLSTSRLINLERCTRGHEYLSCPTLLSGSRPTSGTRSAGTTDCERWWKNNVIRHRGLQLAPWAMSLLQGFPLEWFQSISPFPTATQAELELGILPGESSPHPKQLLPLEWSNGCGENESPGDRTNLPLEKVRASGWLEQRTKTIKGVTYPRVEGHRDKDNVDHWYWEYRYEEKSSTSVSDNGFITRCVYLKGDLKKKVSAINLAIARKWSVAKILAFIKGD